ncbi:MULTISPECIES: acyl carrier protein [Pseudomonas]|uniref:Acyl carrier protein n=3 Tax=Pseudomonas aeruginosa group TaxID=136841 RepID=A0ABD7K3E4_PSEAI|nr:MULTISPECIES: acyl carrier protein [Pseudomonas aeruginosa group]KFF35493.1 hypothetical protein G039_0309345 [Pseudomonas aeruginosa VRFPA01]VTS28208.1 enterobactin synthase subunit F [Streptococcus dysgalactiae subsp. equisimilis]ABR83415.1 hypothetical protein PSPA7_2123 [Pseudomonas aeruginosa PA7]AVK04807.1 phosphopantetheine attachment site family protein [Pseudomonas paraeruginosa]AVR67272.1 acyl carrier protein [Pseudomonas paraeruginosa]
MNSIADIGKIEFWLINTCRELGLRVDAPDSDFFAAGGTSLSAIRLIAKAEEHFGEDALPPEDLFAQSRIHDIASCIQRNSSHFNALTEN